MTTMKVHAQRRIDDGALCGAKRKYPDPRPRLGIAGLAHLSDCELCLLIIRADMYEAYRSVSLTEAKKRTQAASKARHLNALRRKAPAMVEALRELGYTVSAPQPSFTGIPMDEAANYEKAGQCGCMRNPLGHTREEHPS